jgi:hypothetical protein
MALTRATATSQEPDTISDVRFLICGAVEELGATRRDRFGEQTKESKGDELREVISYVATVAGS